MKSYATQPRNGGQFAPLATDKQILELQNLAKAGFVSKGHRINIRSGLKRFVTRADASAEITRLHRMRDQGRAN